MVVCRGNWLLGIIENIKTSPYTNPNSHMLATCLAWNGLKEDTALNIEVALKTWFLVSKLSMLNAEAAGF